MMILRENPANKNTPSRCYSILQSPLIQTAPKIMRTIIQKILFKNKKSSKINFENVFYNEHREYFLPVYSNVAECCSQIIGIIWPTVYYRYMTAKNMAYLWSALTIIFGAIGIVARIKRKPKFLLYYGISCGIFAALTLAVGIAHICDNGRDLKEIAKQDVDKWFDPKQETPKMKFIQIRLKCCGKDGPLDYKTELRNTCCGKVRMKIMKIPHSTYFAKLKRQAD
uniref:Tetraspanin n=1 Tax=Megaselia scalaris TaxID=36166 RepID=T1GVL0_MEGSC